MAIQLILTFIIMRQPHVRDFSLLFWIFEHRIAGTCLIGWHIFNHGWLFWCWRKLASWFWFFISTLSLPLILEMQEFSLPWIDALFPGHNEKPTLITGNHGVQKIFMFFNFVNNFIKNFLSCQLLTLTHSYRTISAHATFLHIQLCFQNLSHHFLVHFNLPCKQLPISHSSPHLSPHVHQFSLLLDSDVIGYFPHSFWKTSCATQTHLTLKGYLLHMPHMIY